MARLWPLLLVGLAIAAVAFLFLGGGEGGILGDAVDRADEEDHEPPELRGHRRGEDWKNPTMPREPPPAEPPKDDPADSSVEEVFLQGRVLDAETETPIAGARLYLAVHQDPCPRLGDTGSEENALGHRTAGWFTSDPYDGTTDAEGRFEMRTTNRGLNRGVFPVTGSRDLFATAKGYVLGVACAPAIPGEVTVRLAKGLTLEGRVRAPDGRAVKDASVRARPGPETPATPGHGTVGLPPRTDEEGRFSLDGLLAGEVLVDVEHAQYMPSTVGPYDPADAEALEITLVPALRATFNIRTDDGRDPEHATLVWKTTGPSPRSEVLLLEVAASSATDDESGTTVGEITTEPVRLPCAARSIVLQIKADTYATWTSEPLRLPSEGGEETFEITLTGDRATGSAMISLEDDAGEKIPFVSAGVNVVVMRLDPGSGASAYVLEQREDLRITDLPAGHYRVLMTSALFAPAKVDLTVEVGVEVESLVRVGPPAKVKVKFFAQEETMVLFRLTQDGQVVHGVPEGALSRGTDDATGEPILAAGQDGLLLSGLAAGTYTVEVLSEVLTAPPTVVHLAEGDTVEVEIHVRPR